jgi:cytochrome c biogenesis protein
MKRLLARLGSTRLTLAGFALLGATVLASQFTFVPAGWGTALPLLLLAVNLAAALLGRSPLRRGGLGLFHVALLGCLLLLAWGRLTHFEGRVELVQGGTLDAAAVQVTSQGPWAGDALATLSVEQGAISVHYAPGVKRQRTRSQVWLGEGAARELRTVGEDQPLRLQGYRLYTTHNKGFAPLVRWVAPGAAPISGALHLPSYPMMDWQQQQRWQPPDGPELRFWLRLPAPVDEQGAWQFEPQRVQAALVVDVAGQRFELQPGQSAHGAFGELRYERLLGWMGYRIHRDPSLEPLALLACLGVLGLALHLWPLSSAPLRRPRREAWR